MSDEHSPENLRAQAESLRQQARDVFIAPKAGPERRPISYFSFWFVCSLILVVFSLSYFLVPAFRERLHHRFVLLTEGPPPTTAEKSPPKEDVQTIPIGDAATPSQVPTTLAAPRQVAQVPAVSPPPSVIPAADGRRPMLPGSQPPVEQRIESGAASPRAQPSSPERDKPRLVRGGSPPLPTKTEPVSPSVPPAGLPSTAPAGENPAASGSKGNEAFKILQDKVPRMAAIASQSDPDYQLKSWTVVRSEEPEIWIDVLAVRKADAQEEHLIWKVHVTDLEVQPLSQSARRLAAK